MLNRWFLFGLLTPAVGILACVAVVLGVMHTQRRPRRPLAHVRPPSSYAVHGIDVSHHQGDIDWEIVARSDRVEFAWIKATQGVTHTDRRFLRNWKNARDAGVKVGAYHYFSMCRAGGKQAEHFIATVPKAEDSLPPAVDVEVDARCNRVVPRGLRAELAAYIDTVEAHYGVRPIVYSTHWFLTESVGDPGTALWLAGYTRQPRSPWVFWQYTDRGRIPGIDGPVDLDVYVGDRESLRAIW